jgi:hypothetical protein
MPDFMQSVEKPKPGHGKGGFVVIKAEKKREIIDRKH